MTHTALSQDGAWGNGRISKLEIKNILRFLIQILLIIVDYCRESGGEEQN